MSTAADRVRHSLRKLKPYQAGKPIDELKRELGLCEVIKLASNEYPEPPSPEVIEALKAELDSLHRYPDPSVYELTRVASEHYGIEPSEIIFGNGANELLEILMHVFLDAGKGSVIYAHPSFPIYGLLAQSHYECGCIVPLDAEGVHDLDAMAAKIDDSTRMIFICNPNNPTATYVSEDALKAFLAKVPDDVIVLLDEAYLEFVVADDFPEFFALRSLHPGLVSLRSMSKSYSLAGLRVGYLIGRPEIVEMMQRARQPFNVNRLAQRAACVAFGQRERVAERRAKNRERLAQLGAGLRELGCQILPSQTNFFLATVPDAPDGLFERLLREGVIVRPMQSFGMDAGSFRVNVGTERENAFFLAALGRVLRAGA
jgi:histidinol-phosphate aminotransferase